LIEPVETCHWGITIWDDAFARTTLEAEDRKARSFPVVDPPEAVCWLHPNIEVRASPIHGLGLFARAVMPAATVVSRLGGQLVDTQELQRQLRLATDGDRGYVDTITVGEDLHLVLSTGTRNGRGNHSCDPNTWWVDAFTLGTRREIAVDEEVTNDYATSTDADSFAMVCLCASPLCRGLITGGDWRRADLRERYGTHWVPAVLRHISSVGGS
jgi:hypothetical protein